MTLYNILCILVYDRTCLNGNQDANCNSTQDEPSNAASTCPASSSSSITVDWFDTILNHSLVMLNVVAVILLMTGVDLMGRSGMILSLSLTGDEPEDLAIPTSSDDGSKHSNENDHNNNIRSKDNDDLRKPSYFTSSLSLLFAFAFQIILCLIVKCVGVSIIWCSIMGWLLMLLRLSSSRVLSAEIKITSPTTTKNPSLIPRRQKYRQESGIIEATMKLNYYFFKRVYCVATAIVCLDVVVVIYYFVVADFITTVAHVCAIVMGISLWIASNKFSPSDDNIETSTP